MKLLTIQEVAEQLRISDETVYALCRSKKIRHNRIGARRLVPQDALDEFLAATTVQPKVAAHSPAPYRCKHFT